MYSQLRSVCLLAFAAAVSAAPTAAERGPKTISIALHPDNSCQVLASGYPGELESGKCYNATGAISSYELYTPPSNYGGVTFYSESGCKNAVGSTSLMYLGCGSISDDPVAYFVKYNRD